MKAGFDYRYAQISSLDPKEKDRLEKATLAWCNKIRARKGERALKALPKGTPWDPHTCPCGSACGIQVHRHTYYKEGDKLGKNLPNDVSDFTFWFDIGAYPELKA